ncbi:hypothetical protein MKO06_02040 [Gramella sp. GC03-9]|uniref:Uncharacterized protein n=1 Tax=Christiangramia oceanisediminis TaxID=2920386 RepID=A0A9X2I2K2_9FLAO|nr:hypothetical protein [Gramella oceanisediminis]MCP9198670.1 hypothetical protein [Gramella oceanisediminis]
MKNRILQIAKPVLLLFMVFATSCSNEQVEEEILKVYDFKIENAGNAEEQLEMLTKAMKRFHNFQVAEAQGYEAVSPLVPGMGVHYAKMEYVDMNFEVLKPEILVYHPDENGDMQFVAAEYLIPIPGCDPDTEYSNAPEGFIGSEDVWAVNCAAGGWTLHAWVGLENENGVFAPYNPALQ